MESISLVYLFRRGFFNLGNFFRHWYYDGARNVMHITLGVFERLDEVFAIKITVRHFFEPLYKDYTIIGRILGIIFRSGRLTIAFIVYFILGAFAIFLFVVWAAIPLVLIFKAIQPLLP